MTKRQKKIPLDKIYNLPEKMRAIEFVTNMSLGEIAKETKINVRTLEKWKSPREDISPHKKTVEKFCQRLKIDELHLRQHFDDFCVKLAKDRQIDLNTLKSISQKQHADQESSLLYTVRRSQSSDTVSELFHEHLKGYWFSHHIWQCLKNDPLKKRKGVETGQEDVSPEFSKDEKYIFQHFLNFHTYSEETNTVLFDFYSARTKKAVCNYKGHMVVASNKLFFVLETVKKSEVEVILISTNKPSEDFRNLHGIMLASTPTRERAGVISKPASTRIVLKKIEKNLQNESHLDSLLDQVGIYELNDFPEFTSELVNKIDDVGILFPDYEE